VNLYADPTKNTVEQIAIEQLVESPFNPRTRFDEQALRSSPRPCAPWASCRPILVRPVTLPGGFAITKGGEPQQAYEIIFGHRRFRAAKIAGEADHARIVRELTDAQAAQLQAIENVQRKDLDPSRRRAATQHYIKVHGVTKDQLAAEIGLSRTHVYSR
jgi:ParB/RepB/Spo0J family partition protein